MNFWGIVGILGALILFTWLSLKGVHTYIAVVPAAMLCILLNGLPFESSFTETYWTNFLGYVQKMWFIAIGGAAFGTLVYVTGGGITIARYIIKVLGKNSTIGITLVGIILEICGVSLFAGSIFIMLPIIFEIYKKYNIPRRFCVSMLCFSALTLACVAPGSTMTHNLIPATFYNLKLYHGFTIGIACMIFMLIIGQFILNRLIAKAQAAGEGFEAHPGDVVEQDPGSEHLPPLWRIIIPMIAYPLLINLLPLYIFFNQLIAFCIGLVFLWGYYTPKGLIAGLKTTVPAGVGIIFSQSAVMGFGSVLAAAPSFSAISTLITSIPGPVYLQVALSTTVASCMCGSASGGINIMLPAMGNTWAAVNGANLSGIARVCGLSSLVFDSMPYNGAINAMCNACAEDLRRAYPPVFWMTVVVPFCGTVLMILLYTFFPFLP